VDAAQPSDFGRVHERLTQIVDEVSADDISLDDALKLYEEAVKLGLSACDLSEQDIEAHLAAEGVEDASARAGVAVASSADAPTDAADASLGEATEGVPDEVFGPASETAAGERAAV